MVTIVQLLFFHCLIGWAIGQLVFCPGDQAIISCDSSDRVRWSGSIFEGQCPPDNRIDIQDLIADNINDTYMCGNFTVTVTDVSMRTNQGDEFLGSTTLLTFSVVSSVFDQRMFTCLDGSQIVVSDNISIPAIPTPSVSVSQLFPTAVTVTLTVGDDHCASMYFAEINQIGSIDPPIAMSSSSSPISVPGLDLCRNRYSVVGYVQAPSGMQGGRNSPQEIPSGVEAVTNVEANTLMLTLNWTQQTSNAPDGCISGYVISWSDGEDTTVGSSTSVLVSSLNSFPFCQTRTLTVAPNTPSGPLSMDTSLEDVIFQHPDFTTPNVSAFFTIKSNNLFINIIWQDVSLEAVPLRMFGFNNTEEGVCSPQSSATGSSVVQSVPGAQFGDSYTVCVLFTNFECMNRSDITVTVPVPVIIDPRPFANDYYISILMTLPPSPPMSPDSLIILSSISSIDPPHTMTVLANYPTSSQQYTVTFEGLTPGTTYTYDIRVVLRNDRDSIIGLQVNGSITVPACGTVCVTVVVVVCVLVVVAVFGLVGGCGAYKYKNRSKDPKERSVSRSENAEKHELTRSSLPPGPDSLYADPNTIEHQAAPGTEDQYAMVDKKVKKNTKPKPTPPEALYQDPNTIEHETAASGDTYAVVDKPKRSSKKKGGPDVVPPASEGLTYADIDLSSKRPKPGSGRQAPQQPGEYPKEQPVEYSSVDHGNTSQL